MKLRTDSQQLVAGPNEISGPTASNSQVGFSTLAIGIWTDEAIVLTCIGQCLEVEALDQVRQEVGSKTGRLS